MGKPILELLRIELRAVDRARSACHDQRAHLRRLAQRISEAGPSAHRLRDERHLPELELVDQCGEIIDIRIRRIRSGHGTRGREASMRKDDAGMALREVRHLLPPRQVVAAEPVREHDRRAAARDLIVDAAIRTLQEARAVHRHSFELR
jgi:hypothetical protein